MLQSFIVYIIFGFSLFLLGSISAKRQGSNFRLGKSTSFWVWEVVLALLIFAFISGVRWNVGVDHLQYLDNYLKIQNGGYSIFEKEYGFEFITRLFAESRIHFSFYFGFLAFLQIFFIYRAFKDEKYLYPFLGIIIIFGPEYLNWMNGIRQMLVATVFIWSIQFIQKRQLLKYVAVIIISSLFHKSAMILLVLYFFPQKDYFKKRNYTFILVGTTLILGNMNLWISSFKEVSNIISYLGYDWYSENLESLIDDNQIRIIGPRRLSIIFIALVLIWFSPRLKIRFRNTYFLTYYNLTILGFLLYNLLSNTHHVFLRPLTYLTIFSIPTTAYLLVYLQESLKKNYLIFTFTLALSIMYLPLSILADNGKGRQDYTNYKFYWYNDND